MRHGVFNKLLIVFVKYFFLNELERNMNKIMTYKPYNLEKKHNIYIKI